MKRDVLVCQPIKVLLVQQKHGINFRVLNEIKQKEGCIDFLAITTEPEFILDYFLPSSGIDVALIQSKLKLPSGEYLYEHICKGQSEARERHIPIILLNDASSSMILPNNPKLPAGIFMSIPLQSNDTITELVEMDNRLRQSIIYTGNTYRRQNLAEPCCSQHNDKIFQDKIFPLLSNKMAERSAHHSISKNNLDLYRFARSATELLEPCAGLPMLPKLAKPALLAIGVSTGGPEALKTLFGDLPQEFPVPILLVQHINANFVLPFQESMNQHSELRFELAENGKLCQPGCVYMSPIAAHLAIHPHSSHANIKLQLSAKPERQNGHVPSVGFLFDSIAESGLASSSVALIMTGMGEDGAVEIGKIKDAGGIALAQDEDSSSIFGMPKVTLELGNAHRAVPLKLMAQVLKKIFRVS